MADPTLVAGLRRRWRASTISSPPADGGELATWTDTAATPANLTQATSANRPIYRSSGAFLPNSKPVVEFFPSATASSMSATSPNSGALTRFMVLRSSATVGGNQSTSSQSNGYDVMLGASGVVKVDAINVAANIVTTSPTSVQPAAGTWYVLTFSSNGSNAHALYVNGTSVATGTVSATTTATTTVIGARSDNSQGFDGYIAEILDYDSALSAGNRAFVHTYLSDEYGITVSDYAIVPTFRSMTTTYHAQGVDAIPQPANKPAGLATNDILLAFIAHGNSATDAGGVELATIPSGFNAIATTKQTTGGSGFWYYKIIADGGSEPSTYSFAGSVDNDFAIYMMAYSGCDTTNPIQIAHSISGSSISSGLPLSVSTSATNCLLVAFATADDNAADFFGTGGMPVTRLADQFVTPGQLNNYIFEEAAPAASTYARTLTYTGTSASAIPNGCLFALRGSGAVDFMGATHLITGTPASGTTSVAPAPGSGTTTGDLMFLSVANRPNTVTPSTPSGWSQVNTGTGGTAVSEADGVGPVRVTVFQREATASETSAVTVTITSGTVAVGVISTWRRPSTYTWSVVSGGTGADTSSGTDFSVTGGTAMAVQPDDVIHGAAARAQDTASSGGAFTATGVTFSGHAERADGTSTAGFEVSLSVETASVATGTTTAAHTLALTVVTASGGVGSFLRMRTVAPVIPARRRDTIQNTAALMHSSLW